MSLGDIDLIEDEDADSILNLEDGDGQEVHGNRNFVLLTNRRLIHVTVDGKNRKTTFVSIQDIATVEISNNRMGFGTFIWGTLAFIAAIGIYNVWDHQLGSLVGSLVVAGMGIFIMFEHVTAPRNMKATFTASSTILQFAFTNRQSYQDVSGFVNRLFQLKDGTQRRNPSIPLAAARTFALR